MFYGLKVSVKTKKCFEELCKCRSVCLGHEKKESKNQTRTQTEIERGAKSLKYLSAKCIERCRERF